MSRGRRALLLMVALVVVASGCPRREGDSRHLRVVLPVGTVHRDPLASFDEITNLVTGNVFQPIVANPHSGGRHSGAVSRWSNPNPETWRLVLHRDLVFHDGRPVRAEDVVATLRAVMDDSTSPLSQFVADLMTVRTRGEFEVEIVTSGRVNLLAGLSLIPVVPKGHRFSGDDIPVGSGPFRVVEWLDHERIVLDRGAQCRGNPNPRAPTHVEFVIARSADRQRTALKTGQPVLFFSYGSAVIEDADQLGLQKIRAPAMAECYLVCNTRSGRPAATLAARRAIAAILDPIELAKRVGSLYDPADDFFPEGVFGHSAGSYRVHDEWRRLAPSSSRRLHLLVMETLTGVGTSLAGLLVEAGYEIDQQVVPVSSGLKSMGRGDFDIAVLGYCFSTGSGLELVEMVFRTTGVGGEWNLSGYRNPMLETLAGEMVLTADPASRRTALRQMAHTLLDDLPWIPLLDVPRLVMHSPDVAWDTPANAQFCLDDVDILQ